MSVALSRRAAMLITIGLCLSQWSQIFTYATSLLAAQALWSVLDFAAFLQAQSSACEELVTS
jgi:hypothetical protein